MNKPTESNRRLEQLYQLSVAIGTTLDLAHETAAFMDWLTQTVEPVLAALFITDEAKQELRMMGTCGFDPPAEPCLPIGLNLWRWLEEQGVAVPEAGDPRRYAVPIPIEKQLFGTLCLVSNRPPEQLAEEQRLVKTAASYLAPVLCNIWRYQTLEQQVAERTAALTALNTVAATVSQSLDLEETMSAALDATLEATGFEVGGIALWDEKEQRLQRMVARGVEPELTAMFVGTPRVGGNREQVLSTGQPLFYDDTTHDPTVNPDIARYGFTISAIIPLAHKGKVLGILSVATRSPRRWTEEEKSLLTAVGHQVAVAVANARLHEETQQLAAFNENIVNSMAEGILIEDAEGYITFVNPMTAELLRYAPEELLGQHWTTIVPAEHQAKVAQELARHLQGVTRRYETALLRKDDHEVPVIVSARPLFDNDHFTGVLFVFTDISERMQAEEALRDAEAKYRTLVEQLPAITYIVEFGEVNRTIYISPQVESLLGFSQAEWLADPDLWVKQLHPDDRERVLSKIRGKDASGKPLDLEYRVLTRDGRVLWFRNQTALVRDETGRIRYSHGVMFDITERKQLEAQLRQAQKMEAIGQLAGGIAHDFNNLLTPIGGFAELLLWKAPEGSQQYEYLRQIKIAADRAAALTGQLRLFTRQAGGERHPIQLNSLVEETRALLERSIPKEITIELRLASELWAVEADPSQISQVLMNLCVNARDAMPDGGTLTLETRNVTLDEEYVRATQTRPGRYVCLGVSDTGCGMSPQVQARLFEPFFTTKEPGKGTGLGLAVIYGIVKGHGGFINVYSEEGRGSTFRVYLPAVESAVEEREARVLELPTGTETILLVDDEETVRELGQRVLERCGYTVLTAEDGVQALEVYQAHREEIALVVLDMVMPQMGGLECLRRLRELDPQVKVLISTGYTANGSMRGPVAEGALGVVEKPFLLQDFAAAVRATLDES